MKTALLRIVKAENLETAKLRRGSGTGEQADKRFFNRPDEAKEERGRERGEDCGSGVERSLMYIPTMCGQWP